MKTRRSLLIIICEILLYGASICSCAPTDEHSLENSAENVKLGALPVATVTPSLIIPPATKFPQKPSRSKHITKSNLYKKPSKDKSGWEKIQSAVRGKIIFFPTITSTGYDMKADIIHHDEPTTTMSNSDTTIDTNVDNANLLKDYTNKTSINSLTQNHSIAPIEGTESIFSNVGKDIDFISESHTTKADDDETYARKSTTERYYTKEGVVAVSTTTTMQGSLLEKPNSIAKSSAADMGALPVWGKKSITSPRVTSTQIHDRLLPLNASGSTPSVLSLSFSQHSTPAMTVSSKLDVGHDGVKITKKKQLFDKHFIATTGASAVPSSSLHSRDNPWPTSKNKPTNSGKKLMEVPNGYLGPIMMKEKTFSVSHHGKKPKPSIVEQLKDKKLVEIIAPTALMEPTTKVKIAVPQPDFVAVDNVVTEATTSTTGGTSTSTHMPELSTTGTTKKKVIESETATTYFLVVTQDTQSSSKEISGEISKRPVDVEMDTMNSTEIETTLKEIYTEVINAMEGAKNKSILKDIEGGRGKLNKTTSSEFVPSSEKEFNHNSHPVANSLVGDKAFSLVDPLLSPENENTNPPETFADNSQSNHHDIIESSLLGSHDKSMSNSSIAKNKTESKTEIQSNSLQGVEENFTSAAFSKTKYNETVTVFEITQPTFDASAALRTTSSDVDTSTAQSVTSSTNNNSSNFNPKNDENIKLNTKTHPSTVVQSRSLLTPTIPHKSLHSRLSTKPISVATTTVSSTDSEITDETTMLSLSGDITSPTVMDTTVTVFDEHMSTPQKSVTSQKMPLNKSDVSVKNVLSTTLSSLVNHDSSAAPSSIPSTTSDITTPLFNTVEAFTDKNPIFSTVKPFSSLTNAYKVSQKSAHESQPAESKISDIQVEVYESTIEPIMAATNFKHSTGVYDSASHVTKQFSTNHLSQERFTQYVVDKSTDFAIQDLNILAKTPGKPEPAAIEIHINVSEGFGNESEDLEFLYRQPDYRKSSNKTPTGEHFITLKPFDIVPQNETSNEAAEEIVVEIIDNNPNSTENSGSRENLNPIFTFRSEDDSQVELKNVKYYPEDRIKEGQKSTDDFFVPHVSQKLSDSKPLVDRDSDTIFYISNTEVKVGESLPTTNTYDTQMKKSRLESQFFPANYQERKKEFPQRYEEDIVLSPLKSKTSDRLKVIRRPLDISYVGESIMEVEQVTATTTVASHTPESTPDVIIEPAVLPEMAIGVPVIGELPPQIELKEIDYMPNFDGNKEESSIQYGGDLIDEGGAMGVGFDMDSYPLGNLGMGRKDLAIPSEMILNHRVNHLKKDVLSADLATSSESADGNESNHQTNDSLNGTVIGEKMGNATAYSVMEDPLADERLFRLARERHIIQSVCISGLMTLIFALSLAYFVRRFHRSYPRNPISVLYRRVFGKVSFDHEKGGNGDGGVETLDTLKELRASSLMLGSATDSSSFKIFANSNDLNCKTSDGDVRDCNDIHTKCSQATDTDLNGIEPFIPDDIQEENATLTVHCNVKSQTMATSKNQAQSATTANVATTSTSETIQSNYLGANGSITTMTLKNNHLIVETEERNDISRDTRVTKMHYDNSEKDGVFVVEVSRGADSKIMPGSPGADCSEKLPFNIDADVKILQNGKDQDLCNQEKVQVHPPPTDNMNKLDELEGAILHQIDEVDECEENQKVTKNSYTGLSQSDLSSSSSVDSNKRYSYGNQELYIIEQQDYTTPSPTATKAPHPYTAPKNSNPENHNDDNEHSKNGHCLEQTPPTLPISDSISPGDKIHGTNGYSNDESKPKITAALLKQDTVVGSEVTNGFCHNENKDNEETVHNSKEDISNGSVDYGANTENGFDSIISLPDPPSTEEIKQMNDIILMDTNQLDSLPPPPPPATENYNQQHNGNRCAPLEQSENGDSHSILSYESSSPTPMKVVKGLVPPTITVADTSAPTNISHTNGNCMNGHTPTATSNGTVVEVSGSS